MNKRSIRKYQVEKDKEEKREEELPTLKIRLKEAAFPLLSCFTE